MATTTPNFGWPVPTSTDLVKNGATAIEALGDSIDASMLDLKGGTTGQVLSKTTNTDMDFTWVTTDDANAIQNSIVDAKGDLISATANDTPARLAVGSNGETLVADSSTSTGLRYQGDFAAGKNKIINGNMNIWQRGTTFSTPADASYLTDRFFVGKNGNATYTVSQQAATYGAIAGYEPNYYCRFAISSIGTTTAMELHQRIEDVTTLAGQTVTVSFWAKADASRALTLTVVQYFGSGGSSNVVPVNGASVGNATTSFQRFTYTFSMPQTTGKTIAAGNFVDISINMPASNLTIDFWGLQVEASNVATSFNTSTGSIQGELAACQRYFMKFTNTEYEYFCTGANRNTTTNDATLPLPVTMRTEPTQGYSAANTFMLYIAGTITTCTNINPDDSTNQAIGIVTNVASGLTTQGASNLRANNTTATIELSAEL